MLLNNFNARVYFFAFFRKIWYNIEELEKRVQKENFYIRKECD